MQGVHRPTAILLGAWLVGAVLAVATPGWPFPGAPVVILLASALAWQVSRPGVRWPTPAMLALCGGVAAFLIGLAFVGYGTGRTPLSFTLGVSAIAILLSAVFCLARGVRAS